MTYEFPQSVSFSCSLLNQKICPHFGERKWDPLCQGILQSRILMQADPGHLTDLRLLAVILQHFLMRTLREADSSQALRLAKTVAVAKTEYLSEIKA